MTFKNSMNFIERIILFFVGAMVLAMMVHITADVIAKNLLNNPLPGTVTIVSNYYMPVITFIPLILVQHYDQHIAVDVAFLRFPLWLQKSLTGITYLFLTIIFALLAWYGWQEAISKYRINAFFTDFGMRFPTWPGYFAPAIGFGMSALYTALQFAGALDRASRAFRAKQ